MTTPISRAAVLEILHTPAASDTFPDMIRRVEALEGCGVKERKTFPILKGEGQASTTSWLPITQSKRADAGSGCRGTREPCCQSSRDP